MLINGIVIALKIKHMLHDYEINFSRLCFVGTRKEVY
jgi:hypothetical protein